MENRDGGPVGWSAALGLALRPVGHALRRFDPALGECLPKSREKSGIIKAVAAERDAVKAKLGETETQLDSAQATQRTAEARIAELERRPAEAGQ